MAFWQQLLAIAGVMVAILTPFALLRWWMYKRDMRELERERQQWLEKSRKDSERRGNRK